MALYALICAAALGCAAPDGTIQPPGTVMEAPILWDGATPYAPADREVVPFTGQQAYQPVQPPPSRLSPLELIARLTADEQLALTAAGQRSPAIMLFLLKLAGASYVDVMDPQTLGGMDAMVAAGLLTAERRSRVLDLSRASP